MGEISLLHIGDIHFGDNLIGSNNVHQCNENSHYNCFKYELNDIQKIRLKLYEITEKHSNSAFLLSGDICFQGKFEQYEKCIAMLKQQLQNNFYHDITDEKLVIVAGNHDIDFDKANEMKNPEKKFERFLQILEKSGFPKFPVEQFNSIIYEKLNVGKLLLISANSCIHWADPSYHPHNLVNIIEGMIEKGELDVQALTNLLKKSLKIDQPDYDLNDVPFIENIDEIIKLIQNNEDAFPIIFFHHNFLPKTYFKKKVYNGLINAGSLRNKLHKLNKPIMVLHGHLHVDPIEIITCPKGDYKESKIICISAPLLFPTNSDSFNIYGFNELKIIFGKSREHKPIGCKIKFYRPISKFKKSTAIKFFDPPESKKFISELEKELLEIIYDNKRPLYLSTLAGMISGIKYPTLSLIEINDAISRLFWLGLVQYEDSETEEEDEEKIGFRVVKRLIP